VKLIPKIYFFKRRRQGVKAGVVAVLLMRTESGAGRVSKWHIRKSMF
jgi:hypothetical protein